jgi:hypothetical protein
MRCPSCHAEAIAEDISCHHCGADLVKTSTSIVPAQNSLPALFSHSPLPRRVAAGVGALALGVGIELLRRNIVGRRISQHTLPATSGLKDLIFSRPDKTVKLPKGYEIHETVVYMTRIIRRQS